MQQEDHDMRATVAMAVSLLKLRIGVAIAASALAGIAVAIHHPAGRKDDAAATDRLRPVHELGG